MECTVKASGKKTFYYNTQTIGRNRTESVGCLKKNVCGEHPGAGYCQLLKTVDPVLEYFSNITSHETVLARYQENGQSNLLRASGQRVAFLLLVRAMFQSNCPFFGRFSFLLSHYRLQSTPELFLRISLLTNHPQKQTVAMQPGSLQTKTQLMAPGIEDRLWPLLLEARRRFVKDALVNAVTMMFNLAMMAAEDTTVLHRVLTQQLLVQSGAAIQPTLPSLTGA
jgi:hypothetical protein